MTLIERWFKEVWNEGRESAIDELSYTDFEVHSLNDRDGKPVQNMDAFKVFYHQFRGAFSDIHVTLEDIITEGDRAAARCIVTARHSGEGFGKPPKGNPVNFTGMTMIRVKDGRIAEAWNNFDFMTMFQQME